MDSSDEHRRIAGEFTATVEGTAPAAWDQPAPPDGWDARDVVRHLVDWFPAFLQEATGITLPAGPSVDDDPVGAWRTQTYAVQALLDDPATAEREYELPHLGRMPLGQAIDMIYTADVFLHRWDLARATGQDERLELLDRERQVTEAPTDVLRPALSTVSQDRTGRIALRCRIRLYQVKGAGWRRRLAPACGRRLRRRPQPGTRSGPPCARRRSTASRRRCGDTIIRQNP